MMETSSIVVKDSKPATALTESAPSKQIVAAHEEGDEELEDEDDVDLAPTYIRVDDLTAHGVHVNEISKLRKRGLSTIGLLATASLRELTEVPGISSDRAEYLRKKAKLIEGNSGVSFSSGLELVETYSCDVKITTGCIAFDTLIGGGIESRTITELFGDSGTGKTQLCHTLCVRAQLPRDQGGAEGCAVFVDTNGTFRPDRLQEIADAAGFDPQQILENVTAVSAKSFEHQCEIVTALANLLSDPPNGEYRLIVIDGIMSHLRAEFAGRGELAGRQQALNQHLRNLKRLADAFNCAIVITNQVTTVPETFGLYGATVKPCGGPMLSQNVAMTIWLRKGRAQQKKATLEHSSFMPKGDCVFSITAAGICEAIEIA